MKRKQKEAGNGYLTVLEAAAFLGKSQAWMYRKVQAKILPHIRIGRNYSFDRKDLEDWVNRHKVKGCLKV